MPEPPAYTRIAAELRTLIATGKLSAGAKLPTETALMARYGVSRTVAKWAISVLKTEGLVEGRRGSGVYVRQPRRVVRYSRDREIRDGSPFGRDAAAAGRSGTWRHDSDRTTADERTAVLLGLEPGAPVMSTRYIFLSDDEPVQLSHSREPLALTAGTPVEWPEESPLTGVVARMDAIGVRITHKTERVTARPALPEELTALRLPPRGALVMSIERTYRSDAMPVETADIVIALDRAELIYENTVD